MLTYVFDRVKAPVQGPDSDGNAVETRRDGVEDREHAFALRGETIAELGRHREGDAIEAGLALGRPRDHPRKRGGLSPELERDQSDLTAGEGRLDVRAADVERQPVFSPGRHPLPLVLPSGEKSRPRVLSLGTRSGKSSSTSNPSNAAIQARAIAPGGWSRQRPT